MSERERWIIYPLLFFALGAALRDKFLQHVTTKEVVAAKIICQELTVTDPKKPDRIVARLAAGAPEGNADGQSFGLLYLVDSEGKELCGVTNNMLQVNQISAREISVVDPQDPQRKLALLTSTTATAPDGATRRLGSLLLTNNEGAAIFGLANDQMQMRTISCQGIAITDPADSSRVLAVLGSAAIRPEGSDDPPQSVGVLQLNDQRFIGLRGNPTEAPLDSPPPPEPAATTDDAEPAADAPAGNDVTADESGESEPEPNGDALETPDAEN